jgi:hypothetical protein
MVESKILILSLIMMTGMFNVVHASEVGKDSVSYASTGSSSYKSRYGVKGLLRGYLPVPETLPRRDVVNEWQMELLPPPTAFQSQSDNPLTANDRRVGVTFKLDF